MTTVAGSSSRQSEADRTDSREGSGEALGGSGGAEKAPEGEEIAAGDNDDGAAAG